MTKFTWSFPQMEVFPSTEEGLNNIIVTVHTRITAIDDSFAEEVNFTVQLDQPNKEEFVPFEKVTSDVIEEWVKKILISANNDEKIIEKLEASLQEKIDLKKAPPVVILRPSPDWK